MRIFALIAACLAWFSAAAAVAAATASAPKVAATEGEKLFALKVKPILAEKCFGCHGEDREKIKGDLDMLTREGLLKGGETSDEVLVPGDAEASLILTAVRWEDPDYEMPPKENDRLSDEQIWAIRDWIDAGAPWLDEQRVIEVYDAYAEGVKMATSGGLSEDWTNRRYQEEDLWAYRPVQDPEVPWEHAGGDRLASPIDAFINRSLAAAGLDPAPAAGRRTWIRRATLDLTGLPPAPQAVEEFLADESEDAHAKVIERLLASPHYGEQWGRHWLDVVRYADSAGFANDYPRPNAWRYRDYVIRAFNEDKPYDQFIKEQIAGDEIDPGDPEMLVATGFLRMGPWEHTGMSVARITRQQFLDDVTDSVGQVFLAHALQCARCHDHKFDPVPTRDYYSIQAVFATTQFAERDAPFLAEENRRGFEEEAQAVQGRLDRNQQKIKYFKEKIGEATRKWCEEQGIPYMPREQMLKKDLPKDKIPPRDVGLSYADLGRRKAAQKAVSRHELELTAVEPAAFSVYDGVTRVVSSNNGRMTMPANPMNDGEMEATCILTGGDPFAKGESVAPGVLSASLTPVDAEAGAAGGNIITEEPQGRRLEFADWIASPDNTLTARVMVNRIWQYHFGKGIAGNSNSFSAMAKKPTHPDLLDWLATRFIESGWSIKDMHRLIMNSEAYRRSSQHPDTAAVAEKDPAAALYAHFLPRRLTAEEIRDGMLFVSGELNPEMGGLPACPEMNLEQAMQPRHVMGGFAPAYQPSRTPEQRNRRSVYALKIRGLRDPFMEVFNQPGPDKSCELRDASTVTPQVFSLFNGDTSYKRAVAMAKRLRSETAGDGEAVQRAFESVYGRPPAQEERDDCLAHLESMLARHRETEISPMTYPGTVTREGFEEMTGEPFTFSEKLDVYDNYIPDAFLPDADFETRALADLCLVLFNSNEFVYVD